MRGRALHHLLSHGVFVMLRAPGGVSNSLLAASLAMERVAKQAGKGFSSYSLFSMQMKTPFPPEEINGLFIR